MRVEAAILCCSVMAILSWSTPSAAVEPCLSGLTPGQRLGPYAAVISTGTERGRSHCFICDTADRPAVVVFAHSMSDPLGKLVNQIDKAVVQHKKTDLRAWVTFLGEDQASLDKKVIDWGRQHAIGSVPLGVFEDVLGPPSYRLARDADVTVLFFVNRKVVANFAFREGELDAKQTELVMQALPGIVEGKKK